MFVKELFAQQFNARNISLTPSLIGRPRHKGGNFRADRLLPDVRERLLNDTSSFCTTFFDFYALPEDFPGRKDAERQRNIADKAVCVQTALTDYLGRQISGEAMRRFIPYVQMYEFEGLLFSSPEKLAAGISKPDLAASLETIRRQFPTPEDINDNYETAPGRRIMKLYPAYRKPLGGLLAAIEMGIDAMRLECRLFDSWLSRLESLSQFHLSA
jgi:hypothetical protein